MPDILGIRRLVLQRVTSASRIVAAILDVHLPARRPHLLGYSTSHPTRHAGDDGDVHAKSGVLRHVHRHGGYRLWPSTRWHAPVSWFGN